MPGKITENDAILVSIDDGTVTVTGLATAGSTQQGAITNATYTDVTGTANGTMIALLKGIFVQLAIIADNTTPTP